MSLLLIKNTAKVPRTLIIAAAVVNSANVLKINVDMIITSGNDGKHMLNSKHYTDEALDFRTHHLEPSMKEQLEREVKLRLGSDYDVILEDLNGPNEHMHVEYDPLHKG